MTAATLDHQVGKALEFFEQQRAEARRGQSLLLTICDESKLYVTFPELHPQLIAERPPVTECNDVGKRTKEIANGNFIAPFP
jgi:hypothetical protein